MQQAACYGRAFVPAGGFPRDGIVGVVRRLRLLNAMREPSVRRVVQGLRVPTSCCGRALLQTTACQRVSLPCLASLKSPASPWQLVCLHMCGSVS